MELTCNGILDYHRCPLLYHFKYNLDLFQKEDDSTFYKSSLQKVFMYFYYQTMNGCMPSENQMKNRWYKVYNDNQIEITDILFKNNKPGKPNYDLEALKSIDTFYKKESKEKFNSLVVDNDVRVKVGNHYLSGTIDLVRELKVKKAKKIEVVRFTNSVYQIPEFIVNNDFRLTFASYAFRELFEAKEDLLTLHNIRKNLRYEAVRTEESFNRFTKIVKHVGDAVEEEKFYPIISQRCRSCHYIDICDKFKI